MILKLLLRPLALISLALAMTSAPSFAQSAKTQVMWLGQSAFKITSPGGKVIITDPWLLQNPFTPPQYKKLEALGKIDVLLVSHGHLDHFADAPALAILNKIPMYAPGDLNWSVMLLGILPEAQTPRFNKGGIFNPVPGITVTAVHAEHSSVLIWKNPATDKNETHVGGEPLGYIIEMENGFRIYFMGDTGLFSDMKFIAEHYKPDLVLAPIGGTFTMGPEDAAFAMREWIKPKTVIPMHYGINPLAKGTPAQLLQAMGASATKVLVLKPGETADF